MFVGLCHSSRVYANTVNEPLNIETLSDTISNEQPRYNAPAQAQSKVTIAISNRVMKITGVEDGTKVEIFTLLGNKAYSGNVSNGEVNLPQLTKGIYIIRIGKYCQKIIL